MIAAPQLGVSRTVVASSFPKSVLTHPNTFNTNFPGRVGMSKPVLIVLVAVLVAALSGAQNLDIQDWGAASSALQIQVNRDSIVEGTKLVRLLPKFVLASSASAWTRADPHIFGGLTLTPRPGYHER
jgi:hypothetical protein